MPVQHLPYEIQPDKNRFMYYENWWKQVALDLFLKHDSAEGKSLLDYGCGRGETLNLYSKAGFKVMGTDTDAECVRIASQHGNTTVLNPADPIGQFGEKSFDLVTCFHVLEHVPSPIQTLHQLSRISRNYLLLAVPNLRYLNNLTKRQIELHMVNEGHLQGWDHWHFRSLAERHCNLELVEWGHDTTLLPFASQLINKVAGNRGSIYLETGLFRRLFPFHCLSVLGLFKVRGS
ncbi:MAG: class I SAM-dependent methyltransferase [Verrucomicrobiales bacterium]